MWAFSFGLIKGHLVAYDPVFVAFVRLAISLLFFTPWLLRVAIPWRYSLSAMGLGAIQFGLMYCLYIASYRYLPAYAVALYTIFTPLYVIGICDLLRRRWIKRRTAAAFMAVLGAALVTRGSFQSASALMGIGLLQLSNLCFAVGQVGYRRLVLLVRGMESAHGKKAPEANTVSLADTPLSSRERTSPVPEAALVSWMYLGATLVTVIATLFFTDPHRIAFDRKALLVLLYLGIVPTGLGFYLWNKGAARVSAGVLAVANNLKIPLAVLCSWFIFSESADYLRVMTSMTVIVVALFLARGGVTAGPTSEAKSTSQPS